jgi:hypothetical protein
VISRKPALRGESAVANPDEAKRDCDPNHPVATISVQISCRLENEV